MRSLAVALIASTALGFAAAASAADLPQKAPQQYYAPAFTWSGFYVGADAGWGWTSGSGTITMGPASGPFSASGNGFLGGIEGGYNWQFGSYLVGLEADIDGSSGSGNLTGNAGANSITGTAKTPYFGTFRGRFGYAADRWLYYLTGGMVYGDGKLDGTSSVTGAFSSSATYWTWTLGAGVEAFIWDRWSAKIEYLYAGKPSSVPVAPGTTDVSGSSNTSIVRVGLNYHF
jgi:outer membrane immunogenic protein